MKTAHWSKVAKAISSKFALSWTAAKEAYAKLKTKESRTPSLRMVAKLPEKLPAALKAKPAKVVKPIPVPPSRAERTAKRAAKEKDDFARFMPTAQDLAANVKLAPPPKPRPVAIKVPEKQSGRNRFERMIGDAGLPIKALARNPLGHEIAAKWRDEKTTAKLVKQMRDGFKQITRDGGMKNHTKSLIKKYMKSLIGEERSRVAFHAILKEMYGKGHKSK